MDEIKSLGQIAYEEFTKAKGGTPDWPLAKGYAELEMKAWEAAAAAVSLKVIKQCAADVMQDLEARALEMANKVFYCTDHNHFGHGPVASIIVAPNEETARSALIMQINSLGLKGDTPFELDELDTSKAHVLILHDGDWEL